MLNTLSIDTKTPNIQDFPKKLHSLSILCAEYSKNSGHSVQFFSKNGKFTILCTNTHNSNILVGENSDKSEFSTKHKQIFRKISAILYVGLQGYKSKFLGYHAQKITVVLIYKINPVQITTITAENTKNSLNSVPHTIENIQFKTKKRKKL